MKARHAAISFFIILVIHLVALAISNTWLQQLSKPLIVIFLGWYVLLATHNHPHPWKKWLLTALIFSLAGDVLLMLQASNELFFLLGLGAFLVAHLFYILLFHLIRIAEQVRPRTWILGLIAIYYTALILFLSPYLGSLTLPVRVYGIVISFMLMLAIHLRFINLRSAGWSILLGAALFVASDSLLAINKFYRPFYGANLLIMLSYGLAQWFIVKGTAAYSLHASMPAKK